MNDTQLSARVNVAKYFELVEQQKRVELGAFIFDRFNERYFNPILKADKSIKSGFTMMAVSCLVIEALESFIYGKEDTTREGKKMFNSFFSREKSFAYFRSDDSWFYNDIRCGILHQAEIRKGWKLTRSNSAKLIDHSSRTINANKFVLELRKSVKAYSVKLQTDDAYWKNFQKKMTSVCLNCGN